MSVNEEDDETEVARIVDQMMNKIGYRDVRTKQMSLIEKLHALDDCISGSEPSTRDTSFTASRLTSNNVSITKIGQTDIRNDAIAKIFDPNPTPLTLTA